MHKCAMCGKEMLYGGYGICSNCYEIVTDLKSIHQIIFNWAKKGYGSIDTCVEYIKHDLNAFQEKCKKEIEGVK